MNQEIPTKKNSIKDTVLSVVAAFVGIQTEKNRQRDFSKGKFSHFVIAAILGVAVFITVLIVVVSLVLPD